MHVIQMVHSEDATQHERYSSEEAGHEPADIRLNGQLHLVSNGVPCQMTNVKLVIVLVFISKLQQQERVRNGEARPQRSFTPLIQCL